MAYNAKNDIRCPVCLREYNLAELLNQLTQTCPDCGTRIAPLQIRFDGYIRLNWQDLRVLVIYATRWAEHFNLQNRGNRDALFALQNILRSLTRFQPPDAPPLLPTIDIVTTHGISTLELDQKATLKPNAEGLIESPYFQKGFGAGQ